MLRKLLLFNALWLLTAWSLQAQMAVTGTVTDVNGEPIPGVQVSEKGTQNGIYTNQDGEFALVVKDGAILIFRMESMKTVEQEASGNMSIEMVEDVYHMDELVISALGIPIESRSVGTSVQNISADEVRGSGEVNMISGLSGKAAGVQVINSSGTPGGSSFIRIRGSRSLDGNNQPLIVVDGVPMDNQMLMGGNPDNQENNLLEGVAQSNRGIDINPDDIESITILKGPNASALYGIAAANGAIVITTKRGKATTGRTIAVTYSASLALDQVNRLPELQNQFGQGISGEYFDPSTGLSLSWGPSLDTMAFNGDATYEYDQNGMLVSQNDPTATTPFTPYDNLGTFFQTGATWNHNFSFSGGTQAATYRLSVGRTAQTGIVPNSEFSRTNVRFASDAQLSRRLRSSVSMNYINSGGTRTQQGSNTSGLMLGLLRTTPSFDNTNGSDDPVNDESAYVMEDGTQRNYRGGGGYDNPYWTVNRTPHTDDVNRFFGSGSLSYDVNSWLNVFYRLGTDAYSDDRVQVFDLYSRTAPGGRMYTMTHIHRHINSDLWVTAKKNFGENFNGSLMVGQNMFNQNYVRNYTQGDGFIQAGYWNLANCTSVFTRQYSERYRKAAIFADAKLAYKNMLYLNLTGRNEWSSTLPENNRSFFYPSASLGFIFTEPLGWTDNNKILPYGKLRISWAQVGQDAPVYSLQRYYNSSFVGDGWTNGITFPIAGTAGFQAGNVLGNPNLQPEKTNSFEVGADLRFLQGRIGVDFTYYSTKSTNQIFNVPVAASSGYLEMIFNSGEVTNKGMELVLEATPIKSKNFRWDIQLNWTRNRNMVVSLADGIEAVTLGGFEGSSVRNVAGQPYGQIYGYTFLRDASGNIVIDDDPGSSGYGFPIASGVEEVIGDPNPDWLAGLRNTLTFKGLAFSFLFDYRKGGDIWNGTQGALTFFGMSANTANRGETQVFEGVGGHLDADGNLITSGATNTTEVVVDENWYLGDGGGFGNVSEHFIQDGSFLKLRDISLSYNIPTKVLAKTPIGTASIGVSARNFLLWTPYQGIDPETNLMGSMNAQGLDYFNMPSTKSYIFSLNLGF